MAFDAGLPPTGWGTTSAAGPWWALSASAPSSAGVDPGAAGSAASSGGSPWLDSLTLGSDGPGSSALLSPLGPEGTGVLYSPASVLGGAALAAAPPDERDALGDADEQAGVDSALLGQPAPTGLDGLEGLDGLPLGAAPAAGAGTSGAPGTTVPTGLGGELSSADAGGLLALQDQWVGAGDGAAQFSQWLGAFAQVVGHGGTGATGALGLDVVV